MQQPGLSPPWLAKRVLASAATAARPPLPNCTSPPALPSARQETCSSLISRTTASGASTRRRESLRPWRAMAVRAAAATAGPRRPARSSTPTASLSTPRATSSSPMDTTAAQINYPYSVGVDAAGNVLIPDTTNERLRRIDARTGIITTIAGNGTPSFSGDGGPATTAQIGFVPGVAVDSAGNLFITDHNA